MQWLSLIPRPSVHWGSGHGTSNGCSVDINTIRPERRHPIMEGPVIEGEYPEGLWTLWTLNYGLCCISFMPGPQYYLAWLFSVWLHWYCSLHCSATPQYLLHIVFLCVLCGKCTPGSRSSSDLVSTSADSLYIHQLILKCRRLAYGSFQLTHVMWWPCHWSRASNGCQIEDKKIITALTTCPLFVYSCYKYWVV